MTLTDLRDKEVVDVSTGQKLGYVCDCEIDVTDGRIRSVILLGRLKWFGLLGREEDRFIPWEKIDIIGADLILVQHEATQTLQRQKRRKKFL